MRFHVRSSRFRIDETNKQTQTTESERTASIFRMNYTLRTSVIQMCNRASQRKLKLKNDGERTRTYDSLANKSTYFGLIDIRFFQLEN